MYWLYNRPIENTVAWIEDKFKKKPEFVDANTKALHAGYNFGDVTEAFTTRYSVEPAKLQKGTYRNISGNEATAFGFLAASVKKWITIIFRLLSNHTCNRDSTILKQL
jgi:2-oxoglutarate ferredoxin oxidoreductase subunit alpha